MKYKLLILLLLSSLSLSAQYLTKAPFPRVRYNPCTKEYAIQWSPEWWVYSRENEYLDSIWPSISNRIHYSRHYFTVGELGHESIFKTKEDALRVAKGLRVEYNMMDSVMWVEEKERNVQFKCKHTYQ